MNSLKRNFLNYFFFLCDFSGPRTRRPKKPPGEKLTAEEKRPRTAFSGPQLARLKVSVLEISCIGLDRFCFKT